MDSNQLGIIGDAHAGEWHRQISLLAQESIEKAEIIADTIFPPGTFAENITTCGIELHKTSFHALNLTVLNVKFYSSLFRG